MAGTQPWPPLGLSCLNHTLLLAWQVSASLHQPQLGPKLPSITYTHALVLSCPTALLDVLLCSPGGMSETPEPFWDFSKHQRLAKSHLMTLCPRRAWAAAPHEKIVCRSLILGPEPNSAPLVTPGSGTVSPVPLAFLGSFPFLPAT